MEHVSTGTFTSTPTVATPVATPKSTGPKSHVITLHAGSAMLTLLATKKADGSATTTVTTKEADKPPVRGMTEVHTSMDAARLHLTTLATKAAKLGWVRKTGVGKAKPDAFAELPKAPKSVVAKAGAVVKPAAKEGK